MDTANTATDSTAQEARRTIRTLRGLLARAEQRHQDCWDETERVSDIRERLCDLEREARAREIASAALAGSTCPTEYDAECLAPSHESCLRGSSATCKELLARIDALKAAARQVDQQTAFYALYSAELAVDKARADLFDALRSLPAPVLAEIGEEPPTQEELDALPNAWGLSAIERHVTGRVGAAGDETDPVDQLNYRRWLVELSLTAVDRSAHLEREMSRHRTELEALERLAANVEFFDDDELSQIDRAIVLQRARIAACREQADALSPAASALDKRMRACDEELRRFLDRVG